MPMCDSDAAGSSPRSRSSAFAFTARARAASDERILKTIRESDDADHVVGILRKDDTIGPRYFDRAVVFVENKVLRLVKDIIGP